ncbi:hypothetical protein KAU30_01740 [Candidatus Bathyarchaeota archaeon]|nr:hypothetical protein [Candidatus Bathyarchaeota archaeon]
MKTKFKKVVVARRTDGTEQTLVLQHNMETGGYVLVEKRNVIPIVEVKQEPKIIKIPTVRQPLERRIQLKPRLSILVRKGYWRGRKLSLEHRQKIADAVRKAWANKPRPVKVYKRTPEHRRKISEARKRYWTTISPEEKSRRGRRSNEIAAKRRKERASNE